MQLEIYCDSHYSSKVSSENWVELLVPLRLRLPRPCSLLSRLGREEKVSLHANSRCQQEDPLCDQVVRKFRLRIRFGDEQRQTLNKLRKINKEERPRVKEGRTLVAPVAFCTMNATTVGFVGGSVSFSFSEYFHIVSASVRVCSE